MKKQINNLYKSERPVAPRKRITDILPKEHPPHSSTMIGWNPFLKEKNCKNAYEPGHRHVTVAIPKKTVLSKANRAVERNRIEANYKQTKEQEEGLTAEEVQKLTKELTRTVTKYSSPVVYKTNIPSKTADLFNKNLRQCSVDYAKKNGSAGSQRTSQQLRKHSNILQVSEYAANKEVSGYGKPPEISRVGKNKLFTYKVSEERDTLYRRPHISFKNDVIRDKLRSSVTGLDVCGLTIKIRDNKKLAVGSY